MILNKLPLWITSTTLTMLFFLLQHTCGVAAAIRRFEFNITMEMINPDCFNQSYAYPVVNGKFPGPTIRVIQGDDVEVLVRNQMTDASTTVHYHGIRQYGTVESDGIPYLTQAPIAPGESFLHRFRVTNQSGTYFYHAHVGLQDDSLHGPFIVHADERSIPLSHDKNSANPRTTLESLLTDGKTRRRYPKLWDGPYHYDDERIIQLSEWWHTPLKEREDYYLGPSFVFDPASASILFNGRTIFDTTTIGQQSDDACPGFTTLHVEDNKTYRFRIIGANSFRTLGFSIMNHTMTIIEVDGELVKPYETNMLEVAAGQRFSVLVRPNDAPFQMPAPLS